MLRAPPPHFSVLLSLNFSESSFAPFPPPVCLPRSEWDRTPCSAAPLTPPGFSSPPPRTKRGNRGHGGDCGRGICHAPKRCSLLLSRGPLLSPAPDLLAKQEVSHVLLTYEPAQHFETLHNTSGVVHQSVGNSYTLRMHQCAASEMPRREKMGFSDRTEWD